MWPRVSYSLLQFTSIRFLIVGVANTFTGLLIIYAGKWLIGLGDIAANLLGYGCGLLLSFVLNKRWSFRHVGAVLPALLRFLLVVLVAYLVNLGLTLSAIHHFAVNSYLAHALGVAPYTVITYLGSRHFVFPDMGAMGVGSRNSGRFIPGVPGEK